MSQPKTIASVAELARYFDGSERDRIDQTGHSRRVSDLMALREQLLRLPDDTYEATINAMRALLDQSRTGQVGENDKKAKKRNPDAAKELYENARQQAANTTAAQPVSKI